MENPMLKNRKNKTKNRTKKKTKNKTKNKINRFRPQKLNFILDI